MFDRHRKRKYAFDRHPPRRLHLPRRHHLCPCRHLVHRAQHASTLTLRTETNSHSCHPIKQNCRTNNPSVHRRTTYTNHEGRGCDWVVPAEWKASHFQAFRFSNSPDVGRAVNSRRRLLPTVTGTSVPTGACLTHLQGHTPRLYAFYE